MATPTTPLTENGFKLFPETNSLSRLRYFFGQLLTQRDLSAEQSYHLRLQRLMQRESFGTGTVAGLRVSRTKNGTTPITAPARSVFVLPGLALDPDGRELILEKEECLTVADPALVPTPVDFPGPPAEKDELADEVAERFGHEFGENDLDALVDALTECGLMSEEERETYRATDDATAIAVIMEHLANIPQTTPTLEPPQILRDWLFEQLIGVTFVGLRYREIGAEPSPAVLDASCCGDVTCFPSRTQQGVFIVTSLEPFPEVPDPFEAYKLCLDERFFFEMDQGGGEGDPNQVSCEQAVCECLLDGWRGLPPVDGGCGQEQFPIVCLARICWSKFQQPGDPPPDPILEVDNCSCRALAPGGPMLRALTESLTGCAQPNVLAPRLVKIEPADGAVLSPSDTVGTTEAPFAIRITGNADIEEESGDPLQGWELFHYAFEGADNPDVFIQPNGPNGSVSTFVGDDTELRIEFVGGEWPEGTYVWRLPNGEADAVLNDPLVLAADSGDEQQLDGEPNPPNAVPSGNGLAGGAFEARFVVKSGG